MNIKNLNLEKIGTCLIATNYREGALAACLFLSKVLDLEIDTESFEQILKNGNKHRYIGRGLINDDKIYSYTISGDRTIYNSINELITVCTKSRIYKGGYIHDEHGGSHEIVFDADKQTLSIGMFTFPVSVIGKLNDLVEKDKN